MGAEKDEVGSWQGEQAPADDKLLLGWLESQPTDLQASLTQTKLKKFVEKAAQPRHVSGNACIKLCFFVEQCRSSKSLPIREIAFSKDTCHDLFNFYIEWNEKNQNRSMRQVLELVSSLIARNPAKETALAIKEVIIQRALSIITHQASHPLVKPAFKSVECLIGKGTISPAGLMNAYRTSTHQSRVVNSASGDTDSTLDSLVSQVFHWMTFPDVSPAAGKFLVTLFRELKRESDEKGSTEISHSLSWQRWIRTALIKDPEILEQVKNYLFPTLFKLDRLGSLTFLEELNKESTNSALQRQELEAHALLKLSASEVGKKTGLLEVTSTIPLQKLAKKGGKTIVLQENAFENLICHQTDTVRSLAFSVLVSSSSPIRPFTSIALDILQSSLYVLHSETDAKIRNEVLSTSKYMVERLRGSTAFLIREIENLKVQLGMTNSQHALQEDLRKELLSKTHILLKKHESFIEWYCSFLLEELIPTASYQRHISALKAIDALLGSGLLKREPDMPKGIRPVNETVWSYQIDFFSPETVYLLMDLLVDPFEDVRSYAASILKLASPWHFEGPTVLHAFSRATTKLEVLPKTSQNSGGKESTPLPLSKIKDTHFNLDVPFSLLTSFIRETEEFSDRSGRADYADGVAHSYAILFNLQSSVNAKRDLVTRLVDSLQKKIVIAEQNLAQAVEDAPVHGNFAALNLVWKSLANDKASQPSYLPQEDTNNLQERIIELCSRAWNVVRSILCDDSPEGHLPEDLDEIDVVDTKDVLSYSFRAVHESSNLLQTIANTFSSTLSSQDNSLSTKLFTQIGNLSFEQLSTLRHRGAFSTVALTFATCCKLAVTRTNSNTHTIALLELWYQGVLECLDTQLSTTRRSAGIPVLLTSIMAAQAERNFKETMVDLIARANRPVDGAMDQQQLPQVHAINSLREVFKSSATSSRADQYLSDCVLVVGRCLRTPIWPIKNSGLLLLRSIIDALLGTNSNNAGWDGESLKIQYDKYASLASVLMDLLRDGCRDEGGIDIDRQVHIVLPVLSVIRRAGPPPEFKDEIYQLTRKLLGSCSWNIRDQAAQTLAVITTQEPLFTSVFMVLESPIRNINETHGVLLAARYMIETRKPQVGSYPLTHLLNAYNILEQLSWVSQKIALHVEVQNILFLMAASHPEFDLAVIVNRDFIMSRLRRQTNDLLWIQYGPYIIACVRQAIYHSVGDYVCLNSILEYCLGSPNHVGLLMCALESIHTILEERFLTDEEFTNILSLYITWAKVLTQQDKKRLMVVRISDLLRGRSFQKFEHLYNLNPLLDSLMGIVVDIELNPGAYSPSRSYTLALIKLRPYWLQLKMMSEEPTEILIPVTPDQNFRQILQFWGLLLIQSSGENEEFDMRQASIEAIGTFFFFINLSRTKNPHRFEFILTHLQALYNGLVDDDESIREESAKIVGSMIGLGQDKLSPVAACEPFVQWQADHFADSQFFACLLISRLTECEFRGDFGPLRSINTPLVELQNVFRTEKALFVEEDQNLFVDKSRGLKYWKDAALRLSFIQVVETRNFEGRTSSWVFLLHITLEGLLALIRIQKASSERLLRGSSRPKGFYTILKFFMCAEVVLRFYEIHSTALRGPTDDPDVKAMQKHWALKVSQIEEQLMECQKFQAQLHPFLRSALAEAIWADGKNEPTYHNHSR